MESGRIAPLRHGKEIVAARRSVSKAAAFKLLWILMTTFYIEQFGCRATQADAAAIERQLRDRGFVAATGSACADVVIVNTSTLPAAPDTQPRDAIRKLPARNPAPQGIAPDCS